ncbi:MAG: hypothetical protein Q9212_003492 [Teloschistes hypoglaucus]
MGTVGPTMAEIYKLMNVDKLNPDMMKDGSCLKYNIPPNTKPSDAAMGLMNLVLTTTTVMRHAYYEADFNTNGHPPHNRPHVGNRFLIVDGKGQVLIAQLAHTRSNGTCDLFCYSIAGKKSLGAGYQMYITNQDDGIEQHSNARQTRANTTSNDDLVELETLPKRNSKFGRAAPLTPSVRHVAPLTPSFKKAKPSNTPKPSPSVDVLMKEATGY